MEDNSQWQAFVETGDIHCYLRYKAQQAQTAAMQQKEFVNGCNRDHGTSTTRSEV